MTFSELTDKQIKAELKARKVIEEEQSKPQPLAVPDWSDLIEVCVGYMAFIARDGFSQTDDGDAYDRRIFEVALKAVYGQEGLDWTDETIRRAEQAAHDAEVAYHARVDGVDAKTAAEWIGKGLVVRRELNGSTPRTVC